MDSGAPQSDRRASDIVCSLSVLPTILRMNTGIAYSIIALARPLWCLPFSRSREWLTVTVC